MDDINYSDELAVARKVALSERANQIESDLLGPYTRHLLTEIANLYPELSFQNFQREDYPRWWSDEDKSTFETALHSLKINRRLCNRIAFDDEHYDDQISWFHLTRVYRHEQRWLEQARHYPRSANMDPYGFHLVREAAFFNLSNRLNDFGRDNLPDWWTKEEVELFYSLVKGGGAVPI